MMKYNCQTFAIKNNKQSTLGTKSPEVKTFAKLNLRKKMQNFILHLKNQISGCRESSNKPNLINILVHISAY